LGEDKGGADDVAGAAEAGGDVVKGVPPSGEDGEAAFAKTAQGSKQAL
jgi:hypothetical protein